MTNDDNKMALLKAFPPDTIDDIGKTDLVQLSRKLVDTVMASVNALDPKIPMTDQRMKEMKMVLNFLNATNGIINTKIRYFKMAGIESKVDAIKKRGENL